MRSRVLSGHVRRGGSADDQAELGREVEELLGTRVRQAGAPVLVVRRFGAAGVRHAAGVAEALGRWRVPARVVAPPHVTTLLRGPALEAAAVLDLEPGGREEATHLADQLSVPLLGVTNRAAPDRLRDSRCCRVARLSFGKDATTGFDSVRLHATDDVDVPVRVDGRQLTTTARSIDIRVGADALVVAIAGPDGAGRIRGVGGVVSCALPQPSLTVTWDDRRSGVRTAWVEVRLITRSVRFHAIPVDAADDDRGGS